jgi:hypothetical protein
MAASDFLFQQGFWTANHTVLHPSGATYGGVLRRAFQTHTEHEFAITPTNSDVQVTVQRSNPREAVTADTPITDPPTIEFRLTETLSDATIVTDYTAAITVNTGPKHSLGGSYRRTVTPRVAARDIVDETGTWTGNNPPPQPGDLDFRTIERFDVARGKKAQHPKK